MTRRQLLTLLTAGPLLAAAGCSAAAPSESQTPELILRYAENQPEDYPTTQAALRFAELVEQRTGGRVRSWSTAAGSWVRNRA